MSVRFLHFSLILNNNFEMSAFISKVVLKLRLFGHVVYFKCQTVSNLQCNKCKRQSVTFEEMTQLSIEVPNRYSSTIEECIRNHFRDVVSSSLIVLSFTTFSGI